MPGKNTLKEYLEGGIYHVYNRGINKQDIVLDEKDYARFLFYLKVYLEEPENIKDIDVQKRGYLERKNFHENIDLLAYCLMPNHFHLMIRQKEEKDMTNFMKCIMTNYSMYFNKRYERVGTLFQGRYKAVLVKNDEYLLHLSRYIHLNPSAKGLSLGEYEYSSYQAYLGKKNIKWLNKSIVLDDCNSPNKNALENIGKMGVNSYKIFVEDLGFDSREILGNLTLESE